MTGHDHANTDVSKYGQVVANDIVRQYAGVDIHRVAAKAVFITRQGYRGPEFNPKGIGSEFQANAKANRQSFINLSPVFVTFQMIAKTDVNTQIFNNIQAGINIDSSR